MNLLQLISCILLSYCSLVNSIMFTLQPNTQKCLREEIKKNDLLMGEFEVSDFPGQQVDYIVTDSKRNMLSKKDNIKGAGKFSVITENHDVLEICFKSKAPTNMRATPHEVLLVVKHSVEAKQIEGLAEASKLRPMEVELKKLEFLADSIVRDFMDMRDREKQMRDTNESTNNRVLYLSIFSMIILLCLAVWQVLYLKKFFKAKKLIE